MPVSVRRVAPSDLALMKRTRLEGLLLAPGAFLSTLADEQAMTDAQWQARLGSNVAGVRTAGFFAVVDGAEQGFVVGVRPDDRPDVVELNAMWVAPSARRRGAARALVEAVCAWAEERGCARVTLCVLDGNPGAVALYESCGFRETRRCVPDGDTRAQIEMERALLR